MNDPPEYPLNDPPEYSPLVSPWPSTKLPLAELSPETATSPAYLEGVVSLQWPFSPSSLTMSLLVCEEDFRLRNSKGQLRVDFRGAAAREVDLRKVQIGDRVQLSLEGAQLNDLSDATARDVPWSVVFSSRLAMKFQNEDGWQDIDIDFPQEIDVASSLAPMIPDGEFMYPPASPDRHQSATPPRLLQASPNEWNTPNIFKRKGDLLDSTPGPLYLQQLFGEEEYNLDAERPRKRPRFSTSFRMVERTPSPQPEGEEDIFDEGPSLGDIEAARLAAMPDGPLTVFRDGPSPKRAFNRPTRIEMPPPPLPLIGAEMDDDQYGETPDSPSLNPAPSQQLPLVSPFPHHGLSEEDDYMSVDTEDRSKITTAPIQESTAPTQEGAESAQEGISPEEALTPAQEEPSGPITSDGESEIDSLFDEMSDREDTRPRKRSGSPLPGPSPLRKFERAKTPEISTSSKKSKLNLQLSTSPIAHRETPRSTPKTPHIYLPTPSPKTLSSEHMGFPFTAPARLDFGARNPEKTPASVQKRNRLRHSLDSAPDDLTTYFGRKKHPKAEKEQTKQLEDSSLTGTPVDEPSTPTEGSIQALRPRSETHKERSPGFKSGIVTPLSDFPALAFLSWGSVVDVIGVVAQHSPVTRAESGQKDYYMAMRIVDSSKKQGVIMRIFRPHETALPEVEVGDVVMLRAFKINSYKSAYMGVSTENSAWAVWKDAGRARPAICAGPPVEYADEEERYVADIGAWYQGLDEKTRTEMEGKPMNDLAPIVRK